MERRSSPPQACSALPLEGSVCITTQRRESYLTVAGQIALFLGGNWRCHAGTTEALSCRVSLVLLNGFSQLTMVFQPGIAVVVALAVGCTLLDSSIGELKLSLEGKGATENSVFKTSRIHKLGIWVDAWGRGRVVPGEEEFARCGGYAHQG